MRTTVRLDDDLLAAAKRRAVETGTTLTAVIEDALRRALGERADDVSAVAPLPTVKGATRAGVDLDDAAALLDLMSGR
jgi:Arc/MetJ family transcription regulator